MIIFFNKATEQIAQKINLPKGDFIIKQFSDGEIYVKVNNIDNDIWIIVSTQPPAENLLELFFLLDALKSSGAQNINLFFTYFAYARQSIAMPGEANTAKFICDVLKQFSIKKILIMQVHAANVLHEFIIFENIIDMDFYVNIARNYDIIAAPDKGAAEFALKVAQSCSKEIIVLEKKRPEHEQVIIESNYKTDVSGKHVLLVDDIISTGNTLIQASQVLKDLGANHVSAAATHGVFSGNSREMLEQSTLKKIYVTNTFDQQSKGKIHVTDISKFIESVILGQLTWEQCNI